MMKNFTKSLPKSIRAGRLLEMNLPMLLPLIHPPILYPLSLFPTHPAVLAGSIAVVLVFLRALSFLFPSYSTFHSTQIAFTVPKFLHSLFQELIFGRAQLGVLIKNFFRYLARLFQQFHIGQLRDL